MMVNLSKLVDGCVDAHITAVSTKDASKAFRALIQHAYDIGVKDGKESIQQKASSKGGKESHKEKPHQEGPKESAQGAGGAVLEDEKAKAAKAVAAL